MMDKRLRIVCDDRVPFLRGVFDPWADVVFLPGGEISRTDVKDADALLVRTRTLCNASLLEGSSVQFIATATIGMDHIDLGWCAEHGITVANAAGCNAGGVMQYVFACIAALSLKKGLKVDDSTTLGIVGVGNVGKKVEALARAVGMKVLLCDPPRAAREGSGAFVDLDTLLAGSDIVTMHVPLDGTTRGMCNGEFFAGMRDGAVFINAARGEIVDNEALKASSGRLGAIVVDTWNGEPLGLDRELLGIVDIATPHIAGYSYQGKLNGTAMAVNALAQYFGIGELKDFYPECDPFKAVKVLDFANLTKNQCLMDIFSTYNPYIDDRNFRADPGAFELLRGDYDLRAEFKF